MSGHMVTGVYLSLNDGNASTYTYFVVTRRISEQARPAGVTMQRTILQHARAGSSNMKASTAPEQGIHHIFRRDNR